MRYDPHKGAVGQLRALLDIPDEQFEQIIKAIRLLVATTFNADRPGRYQMKEWAEIVHQLRTLFPTNFDTNQKLAFARMVVLQRHKEQRKDRMKHHRIVKSALDMLNDDVLSGSKPFKFLESQQTQKQLRFLPPKATSNSVLPGSQQLKLDFSTKTKHSGPTSTMSSSSNIDCSTASCSSSSTTAPSLSSSDMTGIPHVRSFLRNCSPSLEHILPRFIDLGFQSHDILRQVALNWTDDEWRVLIRRLPPDSNGKQMTELEVFALERGFRALRSTSTPIV